MSEGSLPADNPFVDPSLHETPSALQGEATLFVTEDASLTLGADATIILGMPRALFVPEYFRLQFTDDRFVHREAANCCGLLPTSTFAQPPKHVLLA
jgi:sphingosine kinase